MTHTDAYNTIMKTVMPQSFPLGIKLLRAGDEMSEGVTTPKKFGITVYLCQWIGMARRFGWAVGLTADDINCTPCLTGFGFKSLADPSALASFFMEMGYFDTIDMARAATYDFTFLDPGSVTGVLAFPLNKAPVDPDVIVVYGTPAQMIRLTYAYMHSFGKPIHSETTFGLSCLAAVMPAISGEATLTIPGRGERIMAGTDDSEMFLTFPAKQLDDLVTGLEKTQKKGLRFPIQGFGLFQPPLIPPMKKLEGLFIESE